jgi:hypothetical protein
MSAVRRAVVVPVVVLAVLGLGGCHGAERSAAPAGTTASADPLSDVEASVDAIARDLDADADSDAGSDAGSDADAGSGR